MSISIRDTEFDVVVAAGSGVNLFPSVGARAISSICSKAGLKVGLFGGAGIRTRGTIPMPGTGGIMVLEDFQGRVHRVRARSVVRISLPQELPDPFEGWRASNHIPLRTAKKLSQSERIVWEPGVVILGTGNPALKFGAELLESGKSREVYCVESRPSWEGKRYSGWEVMRRRFEIAGGKILEGRLVSFEDKEARISTVKVEDSLGVRMIDVGFLVGAGPYSDEPGVIEYPPGSLLFELTGTAPRLPGEDGDGWVLEENRARWLASKIVRVLGSVEGKSPIDPKRLSRLSRNNVRRAKGHRQVPFSPSYEGKWLSARDRKSIKGFEGVPKSSHEKRPIAFAECLEEIACKACEDSCPEEAIKIVRYPTEEKQFLVEDKCTACGDCVAVCPGSAVGMIQESEPFANITLPWRGREKWKPGEQVALLNRRGESLGTGKVKALVERDGVDLVELNVPSHLAWEARGLRRVREDKVTDDQVVSGLKADESQWVEIHLDGYPRRAREDVLLSVALFELGLARLEDVMICEDGSCGMCWLKVDGVGKLACQTRIRKGMSIKREENLQKETNPSALCSCENVIREEIVEKLQSGRLSTAEAVLSVSKVTAGKCHGLICRGAFKRLLDEHGIDGTRWVDWRFPIADWRMPPTSSKEIT